MRFIKTVFVLLLLAFFGIGAFIWSGYYDVGADTAHWRVTETALETLRSRSIITRAEAVAPPDLSNAELIQSGAGNYEAMCAGCHLSPGRDETELSRGLNPQPPTWDALGRLDPRVAFWAIKHGIKGSGMPAWGKSMDDGYVWGMVAFLQLLPKLDATQYGAYIASSDGHSHGGGETHDHHASSAEAQASPPSQPPAAEPAPASESTPHEHDDAPAKPDSPEQESDEHADHEH